MNEYFETYLTNYAKDKDPDIAINRENWLNNGLDIFKHGFIEMGEELPKEIRVSCGFPKGRSKAIGQVWAKTNSKDGHFEIYISPELDDACRVLDVLLHEVCHIAAGIENGHKAAFKRFALAAGLEGKMTATTATEELNKALEAGVIPNLGKYPHAQLTAANTKKKQTTRMIKAECPACGDIIRAAKQSLVTPKVCMCWLLDRDPKETVTVKELFDMAMQLPDIEG